MKLLTLGANFQNYQTNSVIRLTLLDVEWNQSQDLWRYTLLRKNIYHLFSFFSDPSGPCTVKNTAWISSDTHTLPIQLSTVPTRLMVMHLNLFVCFHAKLCALILALSWWNIDCWCPQITPHVHSRWSAVLILAWGSCLYSLGVCDSTLSRS